MTKQDYEATSSGPYCPYCQHAMAEYLSNPEGFDMQTHDQACRARRLALSGPNDKLETRTVEYNGEVIGEVRPTSAVTHDSWEARDLAGRSHGNRWLSDWWAAQALLNAMGLEREP